MGGDSDETWGVLIAYQGEEHVGRYEGRCELAVEINAYYQAVLSGMDLRQVYLPAIETTGAVTTPERTRRGRGVAARVETAARRALR